MRKSLSQSLSSPLFSHIRPLSIEAVSPPSLPAIREHALEMKAKSWPGVLCPPGHQINLIIPNKQAYMCQARERIHAESNDGGNVASQKCLYVWLLE
ncbi:unnamed protein product [Protopolystoma xenopodis]|uniref:Uncharacterized protein n=1 Tax=Protopolystoma xenopodis TaxID=117903 RepID=A0A448XHD1_9PLAT|nr:unnamed protein product [Protopolystoma xenopodis]